MTEQVRNWWAGKMHEFFDFVHNYVLELIILAFMFLGMCWCIGYFCNALYSMKFDLQSCWGGFTAIGGAGVLATVKYCMDSWKNTPEGQAPSYGKSASQRLAASISVSLGDKSEEERNTMKNINSNTAVNDANNINSINDIKEERVSKK